MLSPLRLPFSPISLHNYKHFSFSPFFLLLLVSSRMKLEKATVQLVYRDEKASRLYVTFSPPRHIPTIRLRSILKNNLTIPGVLLAHAKYINLIYLILTRNYRGSMDLIVVFFICFIIVLGTVIRATNLSYYVPSKTFSHITLM